MKDIAQIEIELNEILTKLDELSFQVKGLIDEKNYDVFKGKYLMKYISRSGNITWKIYDDDHDVVYLRQSQLNKLCSRGRINWLNSLDLDESVDVDWTIHTMPDGDFNKIMSIEE